ncbi:unnamed protein product [Adineta steineri]|uniref:RUN domain-containing protein n=1 Tax=Adineta steineri TaxID=433720 RepID=A0A819QJQ3_9BILA|nr:unnamed protein product [Adineta steineri]CAF4029777.1 unnamed protein product [Adineta steineri]
MNDSCINPAFLSSSAHLENVEQLIKNIEQQTLNGDNFEDISTNNDNNRQEITTKSFTSISSNTLPIHNHHHHSKNITLLDGSNITVHNNDEDHSVDSLLIQRDLLFNNDELKQQISPVNDQNLLNEQDAGYTWDDQYDTRANYRLTFSTDKSQHIDSKISKPRRYKNRSISEKISPTFSDDDISSNLTNNMNDWSMRSSTNTFEQLINQSAQIHSQSNPPPPPPPAPSSCQQQQQQTPTNHSSGSSTTSSSTSWRQMKESHRTTTATETKETRPPSPLCLYKIFQQKSNTTTTSSPSRNIFPLKRYQKDTNVPNHINEINTDKSKSSHLSTDQAIQTSILLDSPSNTRYRTTSVTAPKSESFNYLTIPTRNSFVASHKSLPDLSFISQYSKELPRSRTASPTTTSPVNINRTTPSPILIQHPPKQDADRPRTLKSIKRYKNSKHSTEPLGVFYSPQLRKTFAAIPITLGSNTPSPIETNLKLSSSNLKSCLKYGSRANSCDIQDMVQNHKSTPEHASNNDLIFSAFKNRSSDIERFKHLDTVWTTKICSNKLSAYVLPDSSRGHHSEHDLLSLIEQENSTKKSVSFSENISKQLLSPCNPTIAFNDNPPLALYDNNERLTKRTTIRYRDMRRCQTDIIVVDPVLHLHSFTDSPPNEFCLQRDEDDNDDDSEDILMEKSHINIIPNLDEPVPIIEITPSSPLNQTEFVAIEKENKPSIAMNTSTLDNIVETITDIVKRLFEIKQSDKTFFLDNEQNLQLDCLLKNDLCSAIQTILEHGRKDLKKTNLWKIIESSIDKNIPTSGQIPRIYYEVKQIAQNTSSYWLYKFQAFIFALLNKNELVNWLYYFTRQKDFIQRYYQSPDALILVSISSTFNLFERIMTQLEKLTPLPFRLTYHSPTNSLINDEQLNTSIINNHSTKATARDWVMTISRRTPKTFVQPIVQNQSNDTFRSTLSKKFNAFFSKTNTTQQNKSSSVVTAILPDTKKSSKSPGPLRRSRFPSVFNNSSPITTIDVPSPKLKNSIRQGTSPSIGTFQSKIPRPSLNVDKPKSARYRSTAAPSSK